MSWGLPPEKKFYHHIRHIAGKCTFANRDVALLCLWELLEVYSLRKGDIYDSKIDRQPLQELRVSDRYFSST